MFTPGTPCTIFWEEAAFHITKNEVQSLTTQLSNIPGILSVAQNGVETCTSHVSPCTNRKPVTITNWLKSEIKRKSCPFLSLIGNSGLP